MHGHHGRQRQLEHVHAVGSVRARRRHVAVDRDERNARHDWAIERVRESHRHLEVAGVGGVVAEQDEVVGRARLLARPHHVGDRVRDVDRAERVGVRLDEHAVGAPDGECRAQLLDGLGRTHGQHRHRAARRLGDLRRELDRALLVRADGEAHVPRVDGQPVVGQQHLAGHVRHPLDADQDTFVMRESASLCRVEQRRRVRRADGDRVALAEVLDLAASSRASRRPAAGTPSARACRATARSPRS